MVEMRLIAVSNVDQLAYDMQVRTAVQGGTALFAASNADKLAHDMQPHTLVQAANSSLPTHALYAGPYSSAVRKHLGGCIKRQQAGL